MADEDDRWLPPTPENQPSGPSDEGLPGSFSQPAYPTPEQPGSQWGQPANVPSAPKRGTNGNAVASLVLGIVGLPIICPLVVPSVIALVLGYRGRRQVKETGEEGGGMATAGIIMGWIGVVIAPLIILGFVLLFALADDRDGDEVPDPIDTEPDNPDVSSVAPLIGAIARAGLALVL